MKLCDGIHQIKIDFHVTPEVKRYVYIYLLEGEKCWLIDSGIAGTEHILAEYLTSIGRNLQDITGIFLTHAHPDHIGGAAALKSQTDCSVYASQGERPWIEDIHRQHRERPIPNFLSLVNQSVSVDHILKDGDRLTLEPGMTLRVISSPGHSQEGLSYLWEEKNALFTGDAIPVQGDIPIWIDTQKSLDTLCRLGSLTGISLYCPAWDKVYDPSEGQHKLSHAISLIQDLKQFADACPEEDLDLLVQKICADMNAPHFCQNPLFRQTVSSLR